MVTSIVFEFGLIGLFLITVMSTSLIPFPYEPAAILALNYYSPLLIFIVLFIASICGSSINYFIGLKGIKNFMKYSKHEKKAEAWFAKWGHWIVIIIPLTYFIGDPLALVAGTLNMGYKKFLTFLSMGIIIKLLLVIYGGWMLLDYLASIGIFF